MRNGTRNRALIILISIYGLFALIILSSKETDKVWSILILSGIVSFLLILTMITSFFFKNAVCNTIIEITDKEIIRSGENLTTVKFKFEEIRQVITKSNGTVLLNRGISSNLKLILDKYAYTYEPTILFIPMAVENYEDILKHISSKISS